MHSNKFNLNENSTVSAQNESAKDSSSHISSVGRSFALSLRQILMPKCFITHAAEQPNYSQHILIAYLADSTESMLARHNNVKLGGKQSTVESASITLIQSCFTYSANTQPKTANQHPNRRSMMKEWKESNLTELKR